jgi:hypothetical protein
MCVRSILDLDFETLPGGQIGISYSGRDVSILISHVGIESEVFQAAAHTPKVLARKEQIRKQFAPRRIIFGIDDLDLVKGSVTKLQGLSRFLADNPERRDKVVLVQVIQGSSNSQAEQKAVRAACKCLSISASLSVCSSVCPFALYSSASMSLSCVWVRGAVMAEVDLIRQKYGPEVIEVMEKVSWDIDELVAWYLAAEVSSSSPPSPLPLRIDLTCSLALLTGGCDQYLLGWAEPHPLRVHRLTTRREPGYDCLRPLARCRLPTLV